MGQVTCLDCYRAGEGDTKHCGSCPCCTVKATATRTDRPQPALPPAKGTKKS